MFGARLACLALQKGGGDISGPRWPEDEIDGNRPGERRAVVFAVVELPGSPRLEIHAGPEFGFNDISIDLTF